MAEMHAELVASFDHFDVDQGGFLSQSEFIAFFTSAGVDPTEAGELFTALNAGHPVGLAQFLAMAKEMLEFR